MRVQRWIPVLLVLFILAGCGGGGGSALDRLRRDLDQYPEYSVILQDMNAKGLLAQDYFHRYRLIYAEKGQPAKPDGPPNLAQKVTDWVKVDKDTYDKYAQALGMVVLAKRPDGSVENVPQPPGLLYMGDPRFGRWQADDRGNQFWAWMAASTVLAEVIDEIGDAFEKKHHRRTSYRDWQTYRESTKRGNPYFGKRDSGGRPEYGTQGTVTQKGNTGFFERQQARMAERKATFADKVQSRMGRSKAGSSGMAGGGSSFGGGRRARR